MTAATKAPVERTHRAGFCGFDMPLDIHGYCNGHPAGLRCPCDCHIEGTELWTALHARSEPEPPAALGGACIEQPLFPGFEPPVQALCNQPEVSADRRRTLLQAQAIVNGNHPLGGPLHADADRTAKATDGPRLPLRCGTCAHRVGLHYFPKCDARTVTHGPGTDCRAWWPACPMYSPKEKP